MKTLDINPEPLVSPQGVIDLFEAALKQLGWINGKVPGQFPGVGSKNASGIAFLDIDDGRTQCNANQGKRCGHSPVDWVAGKFDFRSYAIFVVRSNIMGGVEERFKSFNLCLLRGLCRGGQRFAGPDVIAAQKGTFFAEREQKTSTKPGTLRVPGIKLADSASQSALPRS